MDTLKILLAATVALLVGALAVAFNKGDSGKGEDKQKLAELELAIEKMRLENENLAQQRRLQTLQEASARAAATAPAPTPAPAADVALLQEQLAKLEAEKAAAESVAAKAERKADVYSEEAALVGGQMLERRDNELRRARLIKDAMPMARVALWQEDQGFAVVEILEQNNVQEGTVLCVRRKTGILGKLKIDSITIEGAIASPVTAFPNGATPQAGDDLIMDPME